MGPGEKPHLHPLNARAVVERHWGAPKGRIAPRPGRAALEIFEGLASGAVRAVWILCTNPAASMPNLDVIEHPGTERLYTDGRFPTASGHARFVAVEHAASVEPPDAEFPLTLTTGRLCDHWHTMTRTRESPAHAAPDRMFAASP